MQKKNSEFLTNEIFFLFPSLAKKQKKNYRLFPAFLLSGKASDEGYYWLLSASPIHRCFESSSINLLLAFINSSPLRGEGGVRGMKRKNIERCRALRKNQTEAERKLWSILRNRQFDGIKFRRQFPMDRYILDFYCPELRLGIEADGGQHYDEEGRKRDERRTKELKELGVEIIRFSDYEILTNIEGVCEVIKSTIERKNRESPSPQILSPRGRGKLWR